MSRKLKRVRSLVFRNYIAASLITFIIFGFMTVLFGFGLEDEIFDYQLNEKASELVSQFDTLPDSGPTGGVPMQYFIGREKMPGWMQERVSPDWNEGNYEIFGEELGHFHVAVREVESRKLYLLFNARAYIRSTPQIIGYLQILGGMIGVALLVSLFFLYRVTKRVSEPLEQIAEHLSEGETLGGKQLANGDVVELNALVNAIMDRDERIVGLLERERQFNRDASHELRTPLAVASGALEVMEQSGLEGRAYERLKTALSDMKHLTEGILWLGRDPDKDETCSPKDLFTEAVTAYQHLLQKRPVEVLYDLEKEAAFIPVPKPVAQVIIGNLVRNAFSYTDEGSVTLRVSSDKIAVVDTGVGFGQAEEGRTGFGVGLSLVVRLCEHFGLDFHVGAGPEGRGTEASIKW